MRVSGIHHSPMSKPKRKDLKVTELTHMILKQVAFETGQGINESADKIIQLNVSPSTVRKAKAKLAKP